MKYSQTLELIERIGNLLRAEQRKIGSSLQLQTNDGARIRLAWVPWRLGQELKERIQVLQQSRSLAPEVAPDPSQLRALEKLVGSIHKTKTPER